MAFDYNYTEADKTAIHLKLKNPQQVVYCPRCGKELLFRKIGNSREVKCPTDDCLYGGIRGL